MTHSRRGLAFALAAIAAIEGAVALYLFADGVLLPDPSLADIPVFAAVVLPLALVVFFFFTQRGRTFMRSLEPSGETHGCDEGEQ